MVRLFQFGGLYSENQVNPNIIALIGTSDMNQLNVILSHSINDNSLVGDFDISSFISN